LKIGSAGISKRKAAPGHGYHPAPLGRLLRAPLPRLAAGLFSRADFLKALALMRRSASSFNFGISDHPQSAHYAGGLRPEKILRQHVEIDFLTRGNGKAFRLLKGIQSDIRAGSLDYPDDIMARFDFVIAPCAQSVPTAACRANGAYRPEPSRTHLQPYSTTGWPPGVPKARIPNALSLEKFLDHCGRRERARRPTSG
jgi:hypothetical protein